MTTLEHLLTTYGPLMTINQLASLLDRSKDGLRISLMSASSLANELNPARRKIGRRVYFSTAGVARFIDAKED